MWGRDSKQRGRARRRRVGWRRDLRFFCADVVAEGGCKGGFDVVVADIEEVQGFFVDAAGDVYPRFAVFAGCAPAGGAKFTGVEGCVDFADVGLGDACR